MPEYSTPNRRKIKLGVLLSGFFLILPMFITMDWYFKLFCIGSFVGIFLTCYYGVKKTPSANPSKTWRSYSRK